MGTTVIMPPDPDDQNKVEEQVTETQTLAEKILEEVEWLKSQFDSLTRDSARLTSLTEQLSRMEQMLDKLENLNQIPSEMTTLRTEVKNLRASQESMLSHHPILSPEPEPENVEVESPVHATSTATLSDRRPKLNRRRI